jgi:hypothetical protein
VIDLYAFSLQAICNTIDALVINTHGVIISPPISEQKTWSLRSSIMEQEHNKIFGLSNIGTFNVEEDQHESSLLATSLAGYTGADDQIQWDLVLHIKPKDLIHLRILALRFIRRNYTRSV